MKTPPGVSPVRGTLGAIDVRRSVRTQRARDQAEAVERLLQTKSYDVRGLLRGGEQDETKLKGLVQDVVLSDRDRTVSRGAQVNITNGRLVVTHTEEGQKQTRDFLRGLEVARGPQVQFGKSIAKQRAQGLLQDGQDVQIEVSAEAGDTFQEANVAGFILKNYGWLVTDGQADSGRTEQVYVEDYEVDRADISGTAVTVQSTSGADMTRLHGLGQDDIQVQVSTVRLGDLASKLRLNLGQKVQVSSTNLDVVAPETNTLGITFRTGLNGVTYAVIDDAQFRTLMQMDVRNSGDGRVAVRNDRSQDTIVGTDALLANGMTANLRFAGDADNDLDISGNDIQLAHGSYVLIDNGSFLTAVRPGEMRHWTETSPTPRLAPVPLEIEVPRVGQLVKFEKTLVKPEDELLLSATYVWKGGRR